MSSDNHSSNTIQRQEYSAQRLREIGAELDRIHADLDKPLRRGQWLRGLRSRSRKLADATLKAMPRANQKQESAWTEAALARLQAQYDGWIQQLDAILERVKNDDSAQ